MNESFLVLLATLAAGIATNLNDFASNVRNVVHAHRQVDNNEEENDNDVSDDGKPKKQVENVAGPGKRTYSAEENEEMSVFNMVGMPADFFKRNYGINTRAQLNAASRNSYREWSIATRKEKFIQVRKRWRDANRVWPKKAKEYEQSIADDADEDVDDKLVPGQVEQENVVDVTSNDEYSDEPKPKRAMHAQFTTSAKKVRVAEPDEPFSNPFESIAPVPIAVPVAVSVAAPASLQDRPAEFNGEPLSLLMKTLPAALLSNYMNHPSWKISHTEDGHAMAWHATKTHYALKFI